MVSPLLPWEVLERIMGHSGDHRQMLYNFSLTCRDLRPRALCLLVADVRFNCRDHIFDFCGFVRDRPHLKPLVRSVTVHPGDFSPFPLLNLLPNLLELKLITPSSGKVRTRATVLNRSSVTCCKVFGTRIQALHLFNLSFPTCLDLARVLLTFPNLTELVCSDVVIGAEGSSNQAHLGVLKQRLSKRLHLRTISVDYSTGNENEFKNTSSVAGLVLDLGSVQSTVETLTLRPYRSHGLPQSFTWPRLQSLVLGLRFVKGDVTDAIAILHAFLSPSTLKDVTIEFRSQTIRDGPGGIRTFSARADSKWEFEALEQNLLRFPRPRVVYLFDHWHVRNSRILFWTQEFAKHFPALFRRGAFTATFKSVIPGAGHDNRVTALATSPNGKWVVTASCDFTVVLWDTANGAIIEQWIPHNYTTITSLAFSPDSRYLISGGGDSKVKIWDLAEGSRQVTTLEGHTNVVTCCAWSPHGDAIASGSDDQTIRLWEASGTSTMSGQLHELVESTRPDRIKLSTVFRQLHGLHVPLDSTSRFNRIKLLQFSPDGRWLISATLYDLHMWSVVGPGGTLHIPSLFRSYSMVQLTLGSLYGSVIFDPQSCRYLASFAGSGVVKVMDIESGEQLAVLKDVPKLWDVSFSPDGKSVLTASASGILQIWDAHTSFKLFSLKGHTKDIFQACFSPCGKYIASASLDNTVRLWRSKDGRCLAMFSEHGCLVPHVAFSRDGKTLWSADCHGTVIMRRILDVILEDEGGPLVACLPHAS